MRSIFAPSTSIVTDSSSSSVGCSASRSDSVTTRRTSSARSVGRRFGSRMPREMRSRSSRSDTIRSSLRAFIEMREARSRASSDPRSSWLSRVTASPRIAASGVRRSCETACRNVVLSSSIARSSAASSRSACSARSSSAVRFCSSQVHPSRPARTSAFRPRPGSARPGRAPTRRVRPWRSSDTRRRRRHRFPRRASRPRGSVRGRRSAPARATADPRGSAPRGRTRAASRPAG